MARKSVKTPVAAQLPKLPAEVEALLEVLLAVRLRRALVTVPAPALPPSLPLPATSIPRYTGETGNAVSRQRRGRGGAR